MFSLLNILYSFLFIRGSLCFLLDGVSDDPCATQNVLNDTTRSTLYELPQNMDEHGDSLLKSGWYKLMINGSIAEMPTSCVDVFHCGSSKPIWLKGQLPTTMNSVSTLTACASGFVSCCDNFASVQVKNCGTYNVYNLTTLSNIYGRYCLDLPKRCPPGLMSKNGFEPGCLSVYIVLSAKPDVQYITPKFDVGLQNQVDRMLKFKCNFQVPPENHQHFFDVRWNIDGKPIKMVNNLSAINVVNDSYLTATEWNHKGEKNIGFMVSCSVRVKLFPEAPPMEFVKSEGFYAGIVVKTTTFNVNAGEDAFVQIRSTVPIACVMYQGRRLSCLIRFEMLNYILEESISMVSPSMFCKDPKRTAESRFCGVSFDGWNWNTYQTMKIPTRVDQTIRQNHPVTAIVKLNTVGISSDPNWNGYELPDIKIRIQSQNMAPATCISTSNLHIKTFDGKNFRAPDAGEFILYKQTDPSSPIAVHVIHKMPGGAGQICAVAVRAASDTFMVYGCDSKWRHRRAFCDRIHGSYLDVYERNQGKEFEIFLPTGTRVILTINGYNQLGSTEHYINVQIFASTLDRNKVSGLCGTWNGNSNDDFTNVNGQVVSLQDFSRSWHVSEAISLFIAKARGGVIQASQYICSCINDHSATMGHGLDNEADCNWSASVTVCPSPSYSAQQCKFRHARETKKETEIDVSRRLIKYNSHSSKDCIWKNGWNYKKSLSYCTQLLQKSPFYFPCQVLLDFDSDSLIKSCSYNIQCFGDTRLSANIDLPLKHACLNTIRQNTTIWSKYELSAAASSIIENDCPSDCSFGDEQRGICKKGVCECFSNFGGKDCSIDLRMPPMLIRDDEALCDSTVRDCTSISLFGDNFLDNGIDLECRLKEKIIASSNNRSMINMIHMTQADLISFGEIRCHLPPKNNTIFGVQLYTPILFYVSVTTNRRTFSNELPVVVFDSNHSKCSYKNNEVICI